MQGRSTWKKYFCTLNFTYQFTFFLLLGDRKLLPHTKAWWTHSTKVIPEIKRDGDLVLGNLEVRVLWFGLVVHHSTHNAIVLIAHVVLSILFCYLILLYYFFYSRTCTGVHFFFWNQKSKISSGQKYFFYFFYFFGKKVRKVQKSSLPFCWCYCVIRNSRTMRLRQGVLSVLRSLTQVQVWPWCRGGNVELPTIYKKAGHHPLSVYLCQV